MITFRQFIESLHERGELLKVKRSVAPDYELSALLKQAEKRRKAILFESVNGSEYPVVGAALTSASRYALALGKAGQYSIQDHWNNILHAISEPVAFESDEVAPCKHTVLTGNSASTDRLPVPTFFAEDSGPFMTAALGISRNLQNGVINCGYYRVQLLEEGRVVVNVSATSGLKRILEANHSQGKTTPVALIIGAPPALMMAAAAKVPGNISELDVAGALAGSPLKTIPAETSDLPVPCEAEFVIEIEVDFGEQVENTMGEYGDMYGSQMAPVAKVTAITHRECPMFHSIMAGAGAEHNALGMHILCGVQPELQQNLKALIPGLEAVRLQFDPPRMGGKGQLLLRCGEEFSADPDDVYRMVFSQVCDGYPVAMIIRRVILLDTDIDLMNNTEVQWACSNRAVAESDYRFINDVADDLKFGVDARAADQGRSRRLIIPGSSGLRLDDYLD